MINPRAESRFIVCTSSQLKTQYHMSALPRTFSRDAFCFWASAMPTKITGDLKIAKKLGGSPIPKSKRSSEAPRTFCFVADTRLRRTREVIIPMSSKTDGCPCCEIRAARASAFQFMPAGMAPVGSCANCQLPPPPPASDACFRVCTGRGLLS